ncbi:MAG: NAD(P)/FAD-dependent oxidoreductase [bacterium]
MAKTREYDFVVIGGGAAGLVAAATSTGMGAKTLLVEKSDRLGGECAWTGCIPSKTLIHIASVAREAREHGCPYAVEEISENAMRECRRMTSEIAERSRSHEKLLEMGTEVVLNGNITFTGKNELELDGAKIRAEKAIICTGSSPHMPDIPGIHDVDCLTNLNVFELERPPKSMTIIGAGPIGIEFAQAFHELGTKVTVLQKNDCILDKDDRELTEMLKNILVRRGIDIKLNADVERIEKSGSLIRTYFSCENKGCYTETETLLCGVGRYANIDGLCLENIGLDPDHKGLATNKFRRTKSDWVFTAGDVDGSYQFSHSAEYEAVIAVNNALSTVFEATDYKWMPWATFSHPELAHLGPTEKELIDSGVKYKAFRKEFSGNDRALTDGDGVGLVKLLSSHDGKLLGAHILGPRAGELMNELVLGAKKGIKLSELALAVHIYPTLNIALQRAADNWFVELDEKPWKKNSVQLFTRHI